jgi:hypothetical protein
MFAPLPFSPQAICTHMYAVRCRCNALTVRPALKALQLLYLLLLASQHQNTIQAACSNTKTSLRAILVTRKEASDGRQHQTLRDASL